MKYVSRIRLPGLLMLVGLMILAGPSSPVSAAPITDPCLATPTIVGTNAGDILNGTPGNDVIFGLGGGDIINGRGGSDMICAGPGGDVITTGSAQDFVNGGDDNDVITDSGGDNFVFGGAGNDVVKTGPGNDTVDLGEGDNQLTDSGGNNVVVGGSGGDRVTTGGGKDTINAGNGANIVNAGGDNDDIITGSGGDIIDGGAGTDRCAPGAGANLLKNCESTVISATATSRALSVIEDSGANAFTIEGFVPTGTTPTFAVIGGSGPTQGTLAPLGSPSCVAVTLGQQCSVATTYTPAADYYGSDSFQFTLANSPAATVSITVEPKNDAPSFTAGTSPIVAIQESGAYSATWATSINKGAANESGQALTFTLTPQSGGTSGLFSSGPALNSSGTLSFTPATGMFGSVTYDVVLEDNGGDANGGSDMSDTATLTITITKLNALPSASSTSTSVSEEALSTSTGALVTGTNPSSSLEVVTGSLTYSFGGDGQAVVLPFTWGTAVVASDPELGDPALGALQSHDQNVSWSVTSDGLTLTGSANSAAIVKVEMTNVATGSYKVTLAGQLDHPDANQGGSNDQILLKIPFTVRDASGDTESSFLNITVNDDAATANNLGSKDVMPGSVSTGNLLTDAAVNYGADSPGSIVSIVVVSRTFTYDPTLNAIVVSGDGTATHTFDSTTHIITVTTSLGSTLALDFDDGAFVFRAAEVDRVASDGFGFSVCDFDRDCKSIALQYVIRGVA